MKSEERKTKSHEQVCDQQVLTANFTFHFSPHTQAHSLGYTFHSSLFTFHFSLFTFHFSPHTQAHSLGYTFHSSLFTFHHIPKLIRLATLFTLHSSLFTLHHIPKLIRLATLFTFHSSLFTLHSKCFTLIIFFFLLLPSPSSGRMAHGRRVPSRAPLPAAACRRPIARDKKYLWPIASTIMYRPPMPPSAASPMWCTSPVMLHTLPRAPLSLLPMTPKATTPVAAPSYRNTTKDSYIIESFYNDQCSIFNDQ